MEIMGIIQMCMVKASLMQNVDVSAINAIVSLESNYKIKAVSSTKDYGLMQLHKKKIFDPCKNIEIGTSILKECRDKLSHKFLDFSWVVCYNRGLQGARNLGKQGVKANKYYHTFKRHYKRLNTLEMLLGVTLRPQIRIPLKG